MLRTYKPEYADLWFRQAMLGDEDTMSYNHAWGGTILFPEDRWGDWYTYWVVQHEGKRYYRYLQREDGTFVGEIAYHLDEETGYYMANIIIHAPYRKKGYGGQGLDILCAEVKRQGIASLWDDLAIDNPALPLFLTHGFTEAFRTPEQIYLKKEL